MSQDGFERLKKELHEMKNVKRPEIQEAIATARAYGDLKENAEYHAAREAQGMLEAKIRQLDDKLARTEIVDSSNIPTDAVHFGAKVEVKDLDTGDIENYELVGAGDDDPINDKILVSSPFAQAFLEHKVGDKVEVNAPAGVLRFEILKIEY
ncbi:MAG: transcription elongation factor GreA [Candidatus Scalindua sp.]|nr:transcription elongation factor GreA [Candidatus Scalindua sp.]MBT5305421.1 transcription elongation factor GreA [Candidatus Scalindua sp.]MBT6053124.1 transcription elongation factor GreA [Candidatus Scalindua sp.]MBT6226411.1 transcription elongation factor GreA [Candidatus Scalindua sp.]MBT6561212.1 transcription elongation factor GreA [Candidatus Scalindua sp.]